MALCGCRPAAVETPEKAELPATKTHLHVVVVGDPALSTAIGQLKGEWTAQTGATFDVESRARLDLTHDAPPRADIIVAPSHLLPELAVRHWIVPVPAAMASTGIDVGLLAEGSSKTGWSEIFPLIRTQELAWQGQPVAVPFGSPVLTVYYRADILEKLALGPPKTWGDYQKLAELLADRKRLGSLAPPADRPWQGAVEPLGAGWAGTMLLARAAAYAAHRANFSTLFNIDTMEPLVAGPPYVRALEELVAAAGPNAANAKRLDPDGVRRAFWAGQCAMAFTWPTAADRSLGDVSAAIRIGIAELPGSGEAYNIVAKAWERRQSGEESSVPLLGVAGRLGVVTTDCATPEVAFRLLFWLTEEPWCRQVSGASSATTLFRQSAVRSAQAWTERPISPAVAAQYASQTRRSLSRSQWAFALRIPGRADYLAALDEAVQKALDRKQKPQEALNEAADAWRAIHRRLGVDRQRDAYRRSLGL